MRCFICGDTKLSKFLDLGHQPPSDAFLSKGDLKKPEARYPLALYFCEQCGLVQLGYIVDPELLFRDYVYTTGMNNSLRANFKALVESLVSRYSLGKGDLAVDIGSNDGTLLSFYTAFGVRTLGVDPSSASLLAKEKGIATMVDFWNEKTATAAVAVHGKAKIITATNVFAHVGDLDSFMRGLQVSLMEDGVFVSESGYLLDMIETLGYDAIYHEHLRYYSLRPLMTLFGSFGMEIFDVERIPSHNGSIRVYAGRKGVHPKAPTVEDLLKLEDSKGLYSKDTFAHFAQRVHAHKGALTKILSEARSAGKRIVGIGAPAKGNTLLNFCGLTEDTVECLLEKSDLKIGLYAPGTHIPVLSEALLSTEKIDFALMLSWNITPELVAKLRKSGYAGAFIIPFPEPKIMH